jgi:hypothetical protein
MCAFDVTVIAELQYRVIAAVGGRDKFAQVRAPAQLFACAHGVTQPGLIGEIPGDRAGYPAADVVEGLCGLGEVEHGLFDLGPRRIGVSLHGVDGAGGTVKAYPCDCGNPAFLGHRHVDRTNRLALVDEPMQFSRGLIADGRTRTGSEHCCP